MDQRELNAVLIGFTQKVSSTMVNVYQTTKAGSPLSFTNDDGIVVYLVDFSNRFWVTNENYQLCTRSPEEFGCVVTESGAIRPTPPSEINYTDILFPKPLSVLYYSTTPENYYVWNGYIIRPKQNILYYCQRIHSLELYRMTVDGRIETKTILRPSYPLCDELPGLFEDYDPSFALEMVEIPDEYIHVSDYFYEKGLESFDEKSIYCARNRPPKNDITPWKGLSIHRNAIIISAQTGMGKNYFVTHNLRKHADLFGNKILYVSNRVALDYQQKAQLYESVHPRGSTLSFDNDGDWERFSSFGCITLITYHRLLKYLEHNNFKWASQFDYVVLDECHFFCSDALFNPETGFILEQIPKLFQSACRIYMSATPEEVTTPICYFEEYENDRAKVIFYSFHRDYSMYHISFFDGVKDFYPESDISYAIKGKNCELAKKIKENSEEKWLIFVTSKKDGKKIKKQLQKNKITAVFVSSESRKKHLRPESRSSKSGDNKKITDEHAVWNTILESGKFNQQVLISTSVLDNGFSIKDIALKNVVLFTHNRVELLQELGRCRLEQGQRINLFLKRIDSQQIQQMNRRINRLLNVIENYEGREEYPYDTPKTEGRPEDTIIGLWNHGTDECRQLFSIKSKGESFTFRLNQMAKWKLMLQEEDIEFVMDQAQKVHLDVAQFSESMKLKWLRSLSDEQDWKPQSQSNISEAENNLKDFLRSNLEKPLTEGTKEFDDFSQAFLELFRQAYPQSSKINRGRNKVGHCFIQKRFREYPEWQFDFMQFEKGKWKVVQAPLKDPDPDSDSETDDATDDNSSAPLEAEASLPEHPTQTKTFNV